MAVPKRKVSPSRRNMRRAHDALSSNVYVEDKDTGELKRPHHIDLKTGMYRGKQILEPGWRVLYGAEDVKADTTGKEGENKDEEEAASGGGRTRAPNRYGIHK